MIRFLSASLVLATLVIAACATQDDDIWMPPSASGKADGTSIIKGSTIPSSYVDPAKYYLTGREIDSLVHVGALTGVAASLAQRADGIIANLPANGRLEAAELVRMESPAINATLFPDEKAALPTLWPLLVAPAPGATAVAAPAPDLTVTDKRTYPNGLVEPASIAIATLPSEDETVAQRVELVFDEDGDATTIQTSDIDHVLADPSAFTQAEVAELQAIKELFHDRAVSHELAIAVAPEPGTQTDHGTVGSLALDFQSDITILDTLRWSAPSSPNGYDASWSGQLQLEAKLAGTLTMAASDKAILIDLDSTKEYVFDATKALPELGAGTYVLERYVAGQRKETNEIGLPSFQPGDNTTDLTPYIDYQLELANGTPLVGNVFSTYASGNREDATIKFETTAHTYPGASIFTATDASPPYDELPTGRYEIPTTHFGTLTFDVYPGDVILAGLGSGDPTVRLRYGSTGQAKAYDAQIGSTYVRFEPEHAALVISGNYQQDNLWVTPAMRTL